MHKEFVKYEQALALKELGFEDGCLAQYVVTLDGIGLEIWNDENYDSWQMRVSAPLKQQVFRWFRENYRLQHNITWNKFYEKTPQQWEVRKQWTNEPSIPYGIGGMCSTYEEAEDACIDKLIEIIKNK